MDEAEAEKEKITKAQGEGQNDDGGIDDNLDDLGDLRQKMPLPEGVLRVNLGIPIVVAISKVDLLVRGELATLLE